MSVNSRPARLTHLRLVAQRIVTSPFTEPAEAVRYMLAMQAQDFPGAKWSVGLRVPGCTDADVEAALEKGTIVRSWPMRGTLHFTTSEDLPWILGLTSERMIASAATRRAGLELDDATLGRAREIAMEQLAGRNALPREQLLAEFESAGIITAGQRGYHILWHLAQMAVLCFGPTQGKQQTFVLLDEWVRNPLRFEREEALGELARRYFLSHGPATLKDFAWWTKLTLREARMGLESARQHLAEFELDKTTYYMAPDLEDRLACITPPVAKSVALLPGFDEFMLGYTDRSAALAAEHSQRIVPGGNGMFIATIVAGGEVVGTWRRVSKSKESIIAATPFLEVTQAATSKLEGAAKAYGRYLGVPVRVELATVE